MGFFTAFGIVFAVIFFLFFALILLIRIAKYGSAFGSLASTFVGGTAIIDKAGKGEIGELMGYDVHPTTGKIRLRLNYIDQFSEGQTGFIYEPEDFDPQISQIDWRHYAGTIILYWDFERRNDYRETSILNLTRQNKQLKQQCIIYKRMGHDLLNYFEGVKVNEAKEGKDMHFAKAYKTVKSIVEEQNVDNVSPQDKDEMFD